MSKTYPNEPDYSCPYIDETQAAISNVQRSIDDLLLTRDVLDKVKDDALETIRKINDQLRSDNYRLLGEIDTLESRVEQLQAKVEDLETKLRVKVHEIRDLENKAEAEKFADRVVAFDMENGFTLDEQIKGAIDGRR